MPLDEDRLLVLLRREELALIQRQNWTAKDLDAILRDPSRPETVGVRSALLRQLIGPPVVPGPSSGATPRRRPPWVRAFGALLNETSCWPPRAAPEGETAGVMKDRNLLDPPLAPGDWTVRDQLRAPTCVAHAVVACVELMRAQAKTRGKFEALSVRFLDERLRARRTEPSTAVGGCGEIPAGTEAAKIGEAARVLETEGLCERSRLDDSRKAWGKPIPQNVRDEAKALTCRTVYYEDQPDVTQRTPGLARRIHAQLMAGRPVAIALPGFRAATAVMGPTSWDRDEVRFTGRLPDMRPDKERPVPPSGHAVCVVGFQPDEGSQNGYFVFRNCWGTKFGEQADDPHRPAGPSRVPWPGYGTISARHVDALCWEAASFALP